MNYDENGKYYVKLHGHRELEELCQLVAFDAGVCWIGGEEFLTKAPINYRGSEAYIQYNILGNKAMSAGDEYSPASNSQELTVPEWIGFFKWLKERKADKGEGWTKDSVIKKFDKFIEELRNM